MKTPAAGPEKPGKIHAPVQGGEPRPGTAEQKQPVIFIKIGKHFLHGLNGTVEQGRAPVIALHAVGVIQNNDSGRLPVAVAPGCGQDQPGENHDQRDDKQGADHDE